MADDEGLNRLRAALDRVAGQEALEVLAEARAEARSRVRSMLTDVLAQAMLDSVRHQLEADAVPPAATPPPSSRPQAPPPRPDPESGSGFYVYCVTSAADGALPALAGVDPASEVTLLDDGDLAAVVSPVPLAEFDEDRLREHLGDMAWVERIARHHEEVLEAVRAMRTVIPMRLCTIYRDRGGVETMLRREAAPLRTALQDLQGRSEWGVKVFALPRPPAAPGSGPGDGPTEPRSGAEYMHQRRREQHQRGELDEQLDAACETIHARLATIAARASALAPQRPEVSGHAGEMVLNGVYLVAESELPAFHDTVAAGQAEFAALGLELEPTGPWPPYNFVPDAIGTAA